MRESARVRDTSARLQIRWRGDRCGGQVRDAAARREAQGCDVAAR